MITVFAIQKLFSSRMTHFFQVRLLSYTPLNYVAVFLKPLLWLHLLIGLSRLSLIHLEGKLSAICPHLEFRDCSHLFPWTSGASAEPKNLVSLLKFEAFRELGGAELLYFDSDILICNSLTGIISELVASGLGLAAVEINSLSRESRIYSAMTFPINAGFFVIRNTAQTSWCDTYQEFLSAIDQRRMHLSSVPGMICQPIIDRVLAKKNVEYLALPATYNFRKFELFEEFRGQVRILHYVSRTLGGQKPWHYDKVANDCIQIWQNDWIQVKKLLAC